MIKTLITLMLFSISTLSFAERWPADGIDAEKIETIQTGRYSLTKNIPPEDQLNPLKVVIKTKIPKGIATVGDSVAYLLVRSGYTLADQAVLSENAKSLLSLPLPEIHRTIGPMTLDNALRTLSGSAFELVVDPVHRKVAFVLAERLAGGE
jgi:type IV pili sensor histidine kinase/response regulator